MIVRRSHGDCKAIARRLRFAAIAKRLRDDCKAISQRLQSYFAAIAKLQ
jgi:hypothetical protein